MQARNRAVLEAQQSKTIILKRRDWPNRGLGQRGDAARHPREPVDEIERVDALIGEFTAARELGIAAPLFLIARTAAVTVAEAKVDQPADRTLAEKLASARECRMISVVETDLHEFPAGSRGGGDRPGFHEVATHRFLE